MIFHLGAGPQQGRFVLWVLAANISTVLPSSLRAGSGATGIPQDPRAVENPRRHATHGKLGLKMLEVHGDVLGSHGTYDNSLR